MVQSAEDSAIVWGLRGVETAVRLAAGPRKFACRQTDQLLDLLTSPPGLVFLGVENVLYENPVREKELANLRTVVLSPCTLSNLR